MNMTDQRKWIGAVALVAAGVFLLAAGIIASLANRDGQSVVSSSAEPTDSVLRVSLQDAFNAYQDGSAVLVDVRSASSYETAHIPDSLSIPLSEIGSRSAELNPDDWIITVCT
jgi:hypothetical protein